MTKPSPFSTSTTGMMTGSASGASKRLARWTSHGEAEQDGDELERVAGQLVVDAEGGEHVGEGDHDDADEQQAELAPAPLL